MLANAAAGSFSVNPVRVTLTANRPVASLVVHNNGAEPTVVQLETVSWAQRGGQDVYEATREILATPPIFTLPPGGSQVVRVGMRRGADPQRELTYRLFLQEVPPAPLPDDKGLRVVLRVGLPVFVPPIAPAAPALRWHARARDGALTFGVVNEGNAHIQVARSRLLVGGSSQVLATQDLAAYVLPGQSREWVIKVPGLPAPGTSLRVAAQTDAGDMQADVVLE
jgi:fimbrial chaperone protein